MDHAERRASLRKKKKELQRKVCWLVYFNSAQQHLNNMNEQVAAQARENHRGAN